MASQAALAERIEVGKAASNGTGQIGQRDLKRKQPEPNHKFKKLSPKKIEKLILEHRDHGRRLAWSFLSSWRVRMNQDEVLSVVGAALCEAANRFDAEKGVSFKTFFFYHLRGMLLKEIARIIQEQKVLQFVPPTGTVTTPSGESMVVAEWNFPAVDNNNPERLIEQRQIASKCWEACARLDPLEQEVLMRYFVNDEPLIQIAEELDYCRCHISRVKTRALEKLERLLKGELPEMGNGNGDAHAVSEKIIKARRERWLELYTGGRGRRKTHRAAMQKSETLKKILQHSF